MYSAPDALEEITPSKMASPTTVVSVDILIRALKRGVGILDFQGGRRRIHDGVEIHNDCNGKWIA